MSVWVKKYFLPAMLFLKANFLAWTLTSAMECWEQGERCENTSRLSRGRHPFLKIQVRDPLPGTQGVDGIMPHSRYASGRCSAVPWHLWVKPPTLCTHPLRLYGGTACNTLSQDACRGTYWQVRGRQTTTQNTKAHILELRSWFAYSWKILLNRAFLLWESTSVP